jgi:hypothetical protein
MSTLITFCEKEDDMEKWFLIRDPPCKDKEAYDYDIIILAFYPHLSSKYDMIGIHKKVKR